MTQHNILLATLNAKYIHTAFGLRYLYANLGDLKAQTRLCEFTIEQSPLEVVEALLSFSPRIIGLGVYIWNVTELTQVVQLLKCLRPDLLLVLGGPEVSHETDGQLICQLADYVITGEGEDSFRELAETLLKRPALRPLQKIIVGRMPDLATLQLPYHDYTEADIQHRVVYLEASRGCPFRCEFCLSALDSKVRNFPLESLLANLAKLYQRGLRQFKFVDRTFNLKIQHCLSILGFFLERLDDPAFVHFEVIPDRLPEALKDAIARFPAGTLQFEIGIQSFNPVVQELISRRQDNAQTLANLHWLRQHSAAHLHTDLIIGLPGETLASFAEGFEQLVAAAPHEIQIGILKRLRGTPIVRHTQPFAMLYHPLPPYEILQNRDLDFATLQQLRRFARYWDMIGNSGHFQHTRTLLLQEQAFKRFFSLSQWLYAKTGQTHAINLKRLFELLCQGLTEQLGFPEETVLAALQQDYSASSMTQKLSFLPVKATHSRERQPATPARQRRFTPEP